MNDFVKEKSTNKNAVEYLQDKKMVHMIELCEKINSTITINKIYNHDRFACLRSCANYATNRL